MRLAKALGPEQTVYGLEARGLAPNETMMTSLEEMAEAYIAEIRKVRPEGPYYFAGWSFGGPIAYEMSIRLAKAGEQIGLLAFMDCPTPFGQDQPDLSYDDVLRIFAIDLESIERKFDVPLTAWARSDRKVTIEEVIATSQRLGVAPPEYSVPEAQRKIAVFNNCVRLFRRWTPPLYDGPILLFRPVNQDPGIPYEWEQYTSGKITTISMPCNHVRIGFEPFVQTVADHILERMRQPTTSARLGEAAE
jgi:thioesterase domain-containing protein